MEVEKHRKLVREDGPSHPAITSQATVRIVYVMISPYYHFNHFLQIASQLLR